MKQESLAKARRVLGCWLATKRRAAGLSRTQVAELIGKSEAFVGRYEAGSRLGILEFARIAEVLGADPREAADQATGRANSRP